MYEWPSTLQRPIRRKSYGPLDNSVHKVDNRYMTKTQTTKKSGEEIKVGDIIIVLSHAHRIVEIEPYTHPTIDGAIGIARASDGWGISLWAGSGRTLEVA